MRFRKIVENILEEAEKKKKDKEYKSKKIFDKDSGYNISLDEEYYYDLIKKKWPDTERSQTFDDFRNPVKYVIGDYDIVWVKNYDDFCKYINENGLADIICFDHDLGEEKAGYDCAKFVVNYCQKQNLDIPDYDIQSSNNVGKDNIRSLLNNWHKVFKESN